MIRSKLQAGSNYSFVLEPNWNKYKLEVYHRIMAVIKYPHFKKQIAWKRKLKFRNNLLI